MTGELQPAGDSSSPVPREELRVSYEDRDRVAEQLRVAAGDGRLSAEELDERLEIALTARTYAELARVTRDLPSAAGTVLGAPAPKDLVRIDCQSSSVERTGPWLVPRRMEVRVKSGVSRWTSPKRSSRNRCCLSTPTWVPGPSPWSSSLASSWTWTR